MSTIRRALVRYAETAGASQRTREAVALAASEAVANAVIHAYLHADEPGQITVSSWLLNSEVLRIVVADDGRGIQPRVDSPGLGLGLPLMAQLVDKLEIQSAPDRGTEVTMDFRLLT